MKNKLLNMILLCICVVLAVVCCVLTLVRRNESPYFQSEDVELVYHEGMSEQDLLKGLTAYDKEDGEITDKILIRSKMVTDDGLTVTYIVWDSKHEGGTFTRTYEIASGQKDSEENPSSAAGEETQESQQETSQSESSAGTSQEETEAVTEEASQSESESEAPEASQEEPVVVDPEAPVLELTSHSAVIAVGGGFRYWDYIAALEDNKDDFDYLSSQIVIDGQYDMSVPGTYTLVFWVLDSDGNSSLRQELVLTVQ